MFRRSRRVSACLAAVVAATSAALLGAAAPAQATSFVPLTGDGSSWAQPAIDQWSRDVYGRGITINYSGDGSAAGRQHYIEDQADMAATDIAFLTTPDPFGAGVETSSYAYSYVPIVAGGTAFMYNLVVGGHKVTNLRLSGTTLAGIFTGKITNWDDPAITKDYGERLPPEKITPVTRSDGAGASYMFTRWMSKQYASIWHPFCVAQGGGGACGPTEFYPAFSGSVQRNGSDQVASYVGSSSFGQGSIGYDEYAYAQDNNIPVVKLLNADGYYTLPTASNVAIALQAAIIDENPASPTYLMQNLDNVYTNKDPRTYPLSSYSYLIVPRISRIINGNKAGPPGRFNTAKGVTLSTWMNYVLCGAQQSAASLGYSPLPKNLVVGGFKQMNQVPGHVPTPNLQQLNGCNNPTYSDGVNHLIKDAAFPSPCDKVGTPINCVVDGSSGGGSSGGGSSGGGSSKSGGSTSSGGGSTGSGGGSTSSGGGSTGSSGGSTGSGGGSSGGGTGGGATNGSGGGATKIDPDTGQQVAAVGASGTTTDGTVLASSVQLPPDTHGQNSLLATLIAVDIVAVIAVPGLLTAWLRRRRRGGA